MREFYQKSSSNWSFKPLKNAIALIMLFIAAGLPVKLFAQPLPFDVPTISYSSPQTYTMGLTITPLAPTSSGVAAPGYGSSTVTLNLGLGSANPVGVAVDAAGNIYVAESYDNKVVKVPVGGGSPVTLGSGFSFPAGVAIDAAGNVYVADQGNNAVKKIPVGGGSPVTLGSGFNSPAGVAVDTAGNIYVADRGNNAVKKIPVGGGSPVTIGSGFSFPAGVAVDIAGNVYVADLLNNAVKKIPVGGGAVVTLEDTGGHDSFFDIPAGVAVDAAGNVYVADEGNNAVRVIPVAGGLPVTIGSGFLSPSSVAVAATGEVYVADFGHVALKEIKPVGGYYISPSLPAGLSFDYSTGIISGTPALVSSALNYTIIAYNGNGSSSATVNITINPPSLHPTISYGGPQIYAIGTAINPLTPTSAGVAAPGYGNTRIVLGSGFSAPGSVAVDAAGNVYVTDVNTVVKKIPAGGGSPVTFGSGYHTPVGLAVDAAGNVYVTDEYYNTVVKIPVGGGAPVNFGLGSFIMPLGVAVDAAGNVFIAEAQKNAVKMVPAGGGSTVTLGSGFSYPAGVAVDGAGNVYVSDYSNQPIKMIPAGNGAPVTIASGFSSLAIAVDAAGNLFVSDQHANTVKKNPFGGSSPATIGSGFNNPAGVAVDAAGNVYVVDAGNKAVVEIKPVGGYYISPSLPAGLSFDGATGTISGTPTVITPATNYIITAYSTGGSSAATVSITINAPPIVSYSSPQTYTAGTAITSLAPTSSGVAALAYSSSSPLTLGSGFIHPHGVAVDAAGNIYVADAQNNAIKKIPAGGGAPVTFGSGFNLPLGVAVDVAGNVYVADFGNNAVKEISASGASQVTLATGFNGPSSVAVDAAGNVYVSDENNHAIKEIPAGGGAAVTIGPAFSLASGVAVDASGNIYVSELVSHAVKQMPPGGGSPVTFGSGFNSPVALAVDAAGNVYVADFDSMIEKVAAGGGSPGTIASGFSRSDGVAIDTAGNIYVTDQDSDAIKKIKPVGGYFISKPLPAGLHFDETTGIISGTPIASTSSPATDYYITAYNASGHATAKVTITINPIPVPAISYSSPQVYVTGTAIAPLTLTNTGGAAAPAGYGSTATAVSGFSSPQAIALDAAGNLYAVDFGGGAIFKLPAGGGAPVQIAPTGLQPAINAQNIAVNAGGDVFTYDQSTASILKFPADGSARVTMASGLVLTTAIAADAAGNVYAGDLVNNAIVKIPARGAPITINTGFNTPTDIVVDPAGNIFFNTGSAIFKIPAGAGAPVNVPFFGPIGNGLAMDGAGNVFVPSNNSVIEIPVNGGSPIAINAGFHSPRWMGVNAANQLYVSAATHAIYKVTPAGGYYINPGLPAGLSFDTNTGLISGTPANVSPAANYTVTLYNSSGPGSAMVNITVNPLPPTVSSFSPASGPVGTLVTINGANLSNPATLTIGGKNAIAVSNTGSVLVAMVMPGAATGGISFGTAGGAAAVNGTFTVTATPFPSAQQGAKLTVSDNSGNSMLGASAAVSADGNTAIVGGPADNSGEGAAWIFTRSGGVWTQQGPKLVGTGSAGAAAQGTSVAISADGNTAVIGGPGDNNQQGAIWIFTRSGGTWTQQGTKLLGSDNLGPANQGFAVAISADGNTVVSGGYNDGGGLGAVWAFTRIGGIWAQQGLKLSASDAESAGYSVAISADAGTILFGAPAEEANSGGAWFFAKNGDTWSQVGHRKSPNGVGPQTREGTSVALSADGNIGIIGGSGYNGGQGTTWVFYRLGVDWVQQAVLTQGVSFDGLTGPGSAGAAGQGTAEALSADGNVALTGGPADNANTGAAWIFLSNNSLFSAKGTKITGTGSSGAAMQSSSLALSADGTTAISGGPADNSNQGAAWIYIVLAAPTVQASNVTFTNITTAATTASWTNGNGTSRAVFMSAAASGSPAPVDSTVYTANAAFGSGTQIGSSGWYCVYNGTGNTVHITGLAQGATYRVKTVEYNSGAGNIKYLNAVGTNNPGNITTLPAISYSNPQTYIIGTAITPLAPTSSGVAAPGYSHSLIALGSGFDFPTGVAVDAAGNVYVSDSGNNDVKKIPAGGGSQVTIASALNLSGGIAADAAGNVYVTGRQGLILKIPAGGGSPVTIASGFNSPIGVAADAAGNVYVIVSHGQSVTKIPAGGGAQVTLGSGFSSPAGVAVDAAGNVFVSDHANNAIYKIPVGGGAPVAIGSGLTNLMGIAADAAGNIFFGELSVGALKMIPAGGGSPVSFGTGFPQAVGFAVDGAGNLYLAVPADITAKVSEIKPVGGYYINTALPAGLNFDESTGIISGTPTAASPAKNYFVTAYNSGGGTSASVNITVNPLPPTISYSSPQTYFVNAAIAPLAPIAVGVAAPGYSSSRVDFGSGFNSPVGVAADAAGNVYVTDPANNAVYKVPAGGGAPVTLATGGFSFPAAVAVDIAGNVYIADNGTNLITKIPAGGGPRVTLGSGFSNPSGIAVDAAGNVYVADTNNSAIKMIPVGGGSLVTLGSGFTAPYGVAVDGAGNVYVADSHIGAITEIPVGGGPMVTLGSGFSAPIAVAVDIAGNLYVGDVGSHTVKMIPIGGGSPIAIGGSAFIVPNGVAVDPVGNVYVADLFSFKVKEIKPVGGYYISPALPAGLSFDSATGIISGTPTVISPAKNYNVTAYNAGGSDTAAVNIKVVASNADLANLVLSSSTLSPAFATATTSYTAVVSKTTASITITPTAADTMAAIKINGTPVHSGLASQPIPLVTGNNVITIVVKAQDSVTTKTYTVAVTRLGNLPYVSYSGPQGYLTGVTIVPLLPTSFGVNVPGYSLTMVNIGSGFSNPDGVAVDLAGNVYVADFGNNLVKKIPVGGGSPVVIGSGFLHPTAVAVDVAGNVYVADYGHGAIKKIPVGGGAPVTKGSGFIGPDGVAVDAAGNIYVADQLSNLVKRIPPGGGPPVTIGSGFSFPTGVAVDALGNVYVADLFNNAVKKIPAGGGAPVAIGTGFSGPTGVAIDPAGNVYVADYYNNAIKKINLIGGGTVVVGSGIHTPFGIAIDASGKVYVSDASDNLIKKITPSGGYYISPALPAGLIFNGNNGHITGKPTRVSPPTNYTITAYNGFGSSSGAVSIAVIANANLAGLIINSGTLTPAFAPGTTGYADTVSNAIASVRVKPTASDSAAIIKVNGIVVPSGSPSAILPLAVGTNTINIFVKARDGITTKIYTITVVRLPSSNANLASLKTDKAALSPLFAAGTTSYTASVGNGLTSIRVLPVTAVATATITVNGSSVISHSYSAGISLSVGPNTISVVVTAPDGVTTKTYTIVITRAGLGPVQNPLASIGVEKPVEGPGYNGEGIVVHQGISPNGDGQNDFLVIEGIASYPDNKLSIMNRSGALIYEVKGYDNSAKVFDGHSNKTGAKQLPGTYFYSLAYKVKGVVKYKTGFIVLKY